MAKPAKNKKLDLTFKVHNPDEQDRLSKKFHKNLSKHPAYNNGIVMDATEEGLIKIHISESTDYLDLTTLSEEK